MDRLKLEFLPNYTYEDYLNWEGKWELINGVPYAMSPASSILHQIISGKIHLKLSTLLKNCKNCQALLPVDWRISGDDDNNVLQPDNLVICKNVAGNFLSETPEVVFEILSPATELKDRRIKYEIYEAQGVHYYIIVDAIKKIADIFELLNGNYKKIKAAVNEVITFNISSDCSVDFNFEEIWSN